MISEDQKREYRKNQIALFAAVYLQSNLDVAAEAFDVSGVKGTGSVDGLTLEFPDEWELNEYIESLSSDVRIEKQIASKG